LMQDKKVLTTSRTATSSEIALEAGCDMVGNSGGKEVYRMRCRSRGELCSDTYAGLTAGTEAGGEIECAMPLARER
jgi:hypothetical protein